MAKVKKSNAPTFQERWDQNRRQVQTHFAAGYLEEEIAASTAFGFPLVPWPWSLDKRLAKPELPKPVPTPITPTSPMHANLLPQFANDEVALSNITVAASLWTNLYQIDCAAAQLQLEPNDADPRIQIRPLVEQLERCLAELLSVQGLLLILPERTYLLFPILFRLWLAWQELGWSDELETRWLQVLHHSLALTDGENWFCEFSGPSSRQHPRPISPLYRRRLGELLATATSMKMYRKPARWLFDMKFKGEADEPPEPSFQCDQTEWAVLRRDWSKRSTWLSVRITNKQCQLALLIQQHPLLADYWKTQIQIGAQQFQAEGDWQFTCWYTDEDGIYVELLLELADVGRLERQIYLSRRFPLIYLADTLRASVAEWAQLTWKLPIAGTIQKLTGEPRRWQMQVGATPVYFLPLALPASSLQLPLGAIFQDQNSQIVYSAKGQSVVYLPLLLGYTDVAAHFGPWSRLTVTKHQQVVLPAQAQALRIQLGQDHLILFRTAAASIEPYVFVGIQTRREFLLGEMDSDGEFTEWMSVT